MLALSLSCVSSFNPDSDQGSNLKCCSIVVQDECPSHVNQTSVRIEIKTNSFRRTNLLVQGVGVGVTSKHAVHVFTTTLLLDMTYLEIHDSQRLPETQKGFVI